MVDSAIRRREIDLAVCALAVEEGFAAVTIRAVAARMGASTSVVTHYFPSRDELITSALDQALDRFWEDLPSTPAPADAALGIQRFVDHAVFSSAPELRKVWMRAVVDAPGDPVVRASLVRFDRRWDATLSTLVHALTLDATATRLLIDELDIIVSGAVMTGVEGVADADRRAAVSALIAHVVGRCSPSTRE